MIIRFALVTALCLLSQALPAQPAAEQIPVLRASDVLPAELLSGPHHRVDDEVRSDGYLNYYTVESDFGRFEVQSDLMLAIRVREFEALAELKRVSKTEVFAKAAIDAGLSPARAVVSFARRPVETITGIPRGIGRMFERLSRSGKERAEAIADFSDDGKARTCDSIEIESERSECEAAVQDRKRSESLHARYFNVSEAERRWHAELGTDPYTSNDVLYKAVASVAWADRLGRFSIKFAGIPSLPGADYIADVNEIVWSKDPYELHDYNVGILKEAGLDEVTIEAFFDNPFFSPSMQTTLIAALASLTDASGRAHVVNAAINTTSEAEARFVLESIVAMTWYDAYRSPLVEFRADDHFPIGVTAGRDLVVILPVDYLFWTDELAALSGEVAAQHLREADSGRRELWLLGSASPAARNGIERLGWFVLENQRAVIRESRTE